VLAAAAMLMMATPAAGAPFGKLRGIVVDAKGTPQMGATVQVSAEELRNAVPLQLLTNDRGGFSTEKLLPGSYTVRVTLAGFLPAIEKNIRIDANLTTLLRVELGSVFTSLELLRRTPKQDADPDEWKWVLRASTSSRPVLRYANGEVTASGETTTAESRNRSRAHGRLELTSGARHPGSPSNLADAPSTAFAYEQAIGWNSRLVIAGQASYEREAAASISTLWLPSGEPGRGPQTLMVLRRSSMGPEGRVFRGVRMDHSDQVRIGDNVMVRYGAEYLLVGLGRPAQSFRPRGEVAWLISPEWRASFTVAPRPLATSDLPATPMQTALYAMDSFPALMMRSGRPVMESGWHEEASLEHSLGPNGRVLAAVFRDTGSHTAVFGRGDVESPDVLQDFFSNGFTYDGGATSSRGTRVVYEQRLSGEWEATFIYAFAGALAPEAPTSVNDLRDALETRSRHSLAVRVQGRVPRTGTRVTASYKWISGTTVSRQDGYGEALYQLDPALNITLRQPLPRFLFAGKVEALADFRNLLAQGYVPVNLQEGQVLLIPAVRSVRGGLSFQF
jgi:hypothetical protein